MALDFDAVSLTPLTGEHRRALLSLTSGWAPPDAARAISARTIGPEGYRRARRRKALMAAAVLAAVPMALPAVGIPIAHFGGDRASVAGGLEALPYFAVAAFLLGGIAAAISWYQTGGGNRIHAGAEPETQLIFTATADRLVVGNGAGARIEAPWPRWRIAHAQAQLYHMKSGQLHVLQRVELVILGESGGAHAGSVTLDPDTLADGRRFAGVVLGMIATGGRG